MSIDFYYLFSDGASFNNGRKNKSEKQHSSSAIVIANNKKDILLKGSNFFPEETISYAELKGAIIALKAFHRYAIKSKLKAPYNIFLYSDSQYVIKGASEWIHNWKRNKWKNYKKETVAQVELWKELDSLFLMNENYNIEFCHVKGHTGNEDFFSLMNEECDNIAKRCLKRGMDGL